MVGFFLRAVYNNAIKSLVISKGKFLAIPHTPMVDLDFVTPDCINMSGWPSLSPKLSSKQYIDCTCTSNKDRNKDCLFVQIHLKHCKDFRKVFVKHQNIIPRDFMNNTCL